MCIIVKAMRHVRSVLTKFRILWKVVTVIGCRMCYEKLPVNLNGSTEVLCPRVF